MFKKHTKYNAWLSILILIITFITSAKGNAVTENENTSIIIVLEINESKNVSNDLNITYSYYGHENASYGPDEPFSATIGIYDFQLSDNESVHSIRFEKGAEQISTESVTWGNYSITLIHTSDDQKTVTLKLTQKHKI